jgi:hypothetical protein
MNEIESSPGWGERDLRWLFSVAPAGAWMILATIPTVSLWAIICRASGAGFCESQSDGWKLASYEVAGGDGQK